MLNPLIRGSRVYAASAVRFDERPCQLLSEVIAPLPMKPGKLFKEDNEYQRHGTAVVLLAYDLDSGQRYVEVRKRRTKRDYAEFMQALRLQHYPNAQQIHILQDNLNTHQPGSFYDHFDAVTAHELSKQFVFHYTPTHASWLNMAEIEFAALSKQCLDRGIGDLATLEKRYWFGLMCAIKKRLKLTGCLTRHRPGRNSSDIT